jgi:hypothetical protein
MREKGTGDLGNERENSISDLAVLAWQIKSGPTKLITRACIFACARVGVAGYQPLDQS